MPPPGPDTFALPLPDGPRHLDPMDVEMALAKALPDWRAKVDELAGTAKPLPPGTPDSLALARQARQHACLESLSDAASAAFAMPPVDPATGAGYTRKQRVLALAAFVSWSAGAEAAARPLASGGGPTGSPGTAP